MKLSEFKQKLSAVNALNFILPNGNFIPRHFHITAAGLSTKHFIDCGGKTHTYKTAVVQIWVAQDFEHRLKPFGLLNIFNLSKNILDNDDLEIEVEYQTETVGIYQLGMQNENFTLLPKQTDCLAKSNCGVPETKNELQLEIAETACCKPGGGCC